MPVYNFKSIKAVPNSKKMVDVILSGTQRKTPTVIHKSYPITRIRQFYTRKVNTCQKFFCDQFDQILKDFPMVNQLHPFYTMLINVLFSEDHFKTALGRARITQNRITRIGQESVKLIKHGDSLYRCKCIKRAALGKMVKYVGKINKDLEYLEQVRCHLARLPGIDTDARTIIICGFPNVGKSSFINKISRADVEVQPYAFTTKSLFVGYTDFDSLRMQVIDTPGVLDRPLDQCNREEMLSITALSHLDAAVLFMMDLSGHCGYTLAQQLHLFESFKSMFVDKPIVFVANKSDVCGIKDLDAEDRAMLDTFQQNLVEQQRELNGGDASSDSPSFRLLEMSTLNDDGVANVKRVTCEMLLAHRSANKEKRAQDWRLLDPSKMMAGGAAEGEGSGSAVALTVVYPSSSGRGGDGDDANMSTAIEMTEAPPLSDSVQRIVELRKRYKQLKESGETEEAEKLAAEVRMMRKPATAGKSLREREVEEGVDFFHDLRDEWDLRNPQERHDVIPEIWEGYNLQDFGVIPDTEYEALLEEEEVLEKTGFYDTSVEPLPADVQEKANKIKQVIEERKLDNIEKNTKNSVKRRRTDRKMSVSDVRNKMADLGVTVEEEAPGLMRSESRSRSRSEKRPRVRMSESRERSIERSNPSRSRSRSGLRDPEMVQKVTKIERKAQRKSNSMARKGEGDRKIPTLKPKHLYSGKRTIGKTDRR